MGGRGSSSFYSYFANDSKEEREAHFERLTRKSKLTAEQKETILRKMDKDPAYLNKRGSMLIRKIQGKYGLYSSSDTGFITIGKKQDAQEALAEMKKKGEKYGIFQDASLVKTSGEWEIYHGW